MSEKKKPPFFYVTVMEFGMYLWLVIKLCMNTVLYSKISTRETHFTISYKLIIFKKNKLNMIGLNK